MRRWGHSGGQAGYTPAVIIPPITVQWAWVGNVAEDSATVKLRSTDATSVTLRYSTDSGLAGYSTVSGTEGSDDVWTVNLSGLTPNTPYFFGFAGSSVTGKLTTWPTEGTAHSFVIAAASCSGDSPQYAGAAANVSNTPAYDRIREHDPLLFIHMGDLHYRNSNTTDAATRRAIYQDVLAESRFSQLVREVPTAYIYDDHDYCGNDTNGSAAGKAIAQQVYGEYVPHWPLEGPNGELYQSFVIGRVPFLLLDARSERSSNGATDNSSKTRLGADQKQWLKDSLDTYLATYPMAVVEVVSWIGDTSGFADGWDSFSTERTELFDFLSANGYMDKVFLLGGDIHELLYDDGTNTNFETGASSSGPPYAGFAPLDATFNDFSASAQQTFQTRRQQYGTLDFTDTGSQITVRARGWALSASPGSTSSVQFDESVVFPG